ncbi:MULTISPECIES: LOG family protein [Sphingomonas]|uniref:AMP nucleosidase n=1 Tax=Sphingomonas lycopersici TaxID=2951807 RepID=A0AA42CR00_9SPHN|nr:MULTISPECIES: LOG family protein [Sphingomonas]MCW6531165.1 LOG family protein [Sphingomonas lycopersici]MCW6535547.1 LOG family protein [Sphingomonas lycopersici]OJU14700.1 MAG: lysine decarboxylase [Sphingomonas sp. 66-10]
MTETRVPARVFPRAKQDAETARESISTPQTENPAYRLAFQDMDFLLREDLRPVRFQLELLKPQLLLDEAHIGSTFVFYGSARIPEPDKAQALLDLATDEKGRRIAERLVAKSHYYEMARELARLASNFPRDESGRRHFVVCSGGGPSIMEAANRGATDVHADSIGLNIVLPHEQAPNPYVTPSLSMQFHYFALRKMHFLLHARALAAFPGGFGTFDELFELLTLIQTGKIARIPVLLFGREFWQRVVNFDALVEEGVVSEKDLDIFTYVETAAEGWSVVQRFYQEQTPKV